jgi:hypothetical protein
MTVTKFIQEVIDEICLDDRIQDGTFNINNGYHLDILREYVANKVDNEFADALLEQINVSEGNFPERQAYNEDGILVTFPDPESKKAAIERGTHFENPPAGTQSDTDSDDSPSDTTTSDSVETPDAAPDDSSGEDSDTSDDGESDDIFSDFESPESAIADKETSDFSGIDDADDIKLRDDDFEGEDIPAEVVHVYDVLEKVKLSKADEETPEISFDTLVDNGELHPTILFALKQKWEYDRGGRWYDETNRLRGQTDRRGQLDPYRAQDKDEMLIWLDDYLKRRKSKK